MIGRRYWLLSAMAILTGVGGMVGLLGLFDVVPAMQKPDGTPKDIFVEDNLHMTPEGYALWTPLVDAALDAGQSAKAPGC